MGPTGRLLDDDGTIVGRSGRRPMVLFIAIIAFAFVLGLLLKGSVREFEHVRLRWWGLVVVGLGLQFVPLPIGREGGDLAIRILVLGASYGALIAFAILNRGMPGVPLVLVGLVMNAAVIVPNGGMPVSREAIERSGQSDMLAMLLEEDAAKHHLMSEDDILRPLGDVIPIPEPVGTIISPGDVFVYGGIVWVIVSIMRGRTRSTSRGPTDSYRGKHRSGDSPEPAPPPVIQD